MELLKIKCVYCGGISVLKARVITPYAGKIVRLKCGNPCCANNLKIKVPTH